MVGLLELQWSQHSRQQRGYQLQLDAIAHQVQRLLLLPGKRRHLPLGQHLLVAVILGARNISWIQLGVLSGAPSAHCILWLLARNFPATPEIVDRRVHQQLHDEARP